ncbi:MAG: lipid A biosynthesis lauroyl acyltransferase [Acetobacteraceae bacterium]|nr:lipid A biosynthesis lauroyl acyltransferase [Acetobacteraceae bacterium]
MRLTLRPLATLGDWIGGGVVLALFALLRRLGPARAAASCGAIARTLGPWLPVHRTGLANIRAAFPEKDEAWHDATLRDAWDNLGRVAGEYVHLARLWDLDVENPRQGRVQTDDIALFNELLNDGKPALCFSAHLANWELSALAPPTYGMPSAVVYRMPNNAVVARAIQKIRAASMGQLIRTRNQAPIEISAALHAGKHVGMLADQHFSRGVDVTFFGRRCKANPAVARLARHFECPVIGVHAVRRPDGGFDIEGDGPLTLPRDAKGEIDVAAATQMMTGIVEGWIREHPGQWLWFHRRWR